jgi:hypothetical protein
MPECMVCLEDKADYVVLPCSHELCTACFPKVQDQYSECPLCQQPFLMDTKVEDTRVLICANLLACSCGIALIFGMCKRIGLL